jgi:hypothetical protein
MRGPSRLGRHPGPHLPWRRVADVLGVSALELGDPVPLGILVEPHDGSVGNHPSPVA